MPQPRPGSPSLGPPWLTSLSGRTLALVVAAGAALAFLLGRVGAVSEDAAAAAVGLLVAFAAALFVVREALAARLDAPLRALGLVAAGGLAAATAWPVLTTVRAGDPLFIADLAELGARAALPPGLSGPVRLLVRTRLPEGAQAEVRFRLGGPKPPAEGQVERTMSYARVGRSMRAPVSTDHPMTWLDARLPRGAAALSLDWLDGKPQGPLHVEVYPEALTVGWLWAATILLLLVTAVLQARGGGHAASTAGMALAFALVVRWQVTPDAPLTPTVGAIALGALIGAVGGGLLTWLVRRVVKPLDLQAQRRGK